MSGGRRRDSACGHSRPRTSRAFFVLGVAGVAGPVGGRGQHLVGLGVALRSRDKSDLPSVANFYPYDRFDGDADLVEGDFGADLVAKDALIVLGPLLQGGKVEVLLGGAAPFRAVLAVFAPPCLGGLEQAFLVAGVGAVVGDGGVRRSGCRVVVEVTDHARPAMISFAFSPASNTCPLMRTSS
jgi:hypothetical protein